MRFFFVCKAIQKPGINGQDLHDVTNAHFVSIYILHIAREALIN